MKGDVHHMDIPVLSILNFFVPAKYQRRVGIQASMLAEAASDSVEPEVCQSQPTGTGSGPPADLQCRICGVVFNFKYEYYHHRASRTFGRCGRGASGGPSATGNTADGTTPSQPGRGSASGFGPASDAGIAVSS
jgi:hypothetical protein